MSERKKGRKKGFKDRYQIKVENEKRAMIFDFLKKGPANRSQIAAGVGMQRRTVNKHLEWLEKQGKLLDDNGFFRLKPDVKVELSPFEKEIIEYISKEEPAVSHTDRFEALDIGRIFLFYDSLEDDKWWKFWQLMDPLVHAFHDTNPFWLQYIFSYALQEKLIDEKFFTGKRSLETIQDKELNNIWNGLFGDSEFFASLFFFNPKRLLEWLKTPGGKRDLKNALPNKMRRRLYDQIPELRKLWKAS